MAQAVAIEKQPRAELYRPKHPVRLITAAALFDGHDAAINIMRRLLQATGAEVIHLGHNRSVAEIVDAAIQEDAQGVAITSYQGGHVEFFTYLRQLLDERGARHVRIFGGGGGVIVPSEIEELHAARHRPHLLARGRPTAGPAGDDRRRPRRVRLRSRRTRRWRPTPIAFQRLARAITLRRAGTPAPAHRTGPAPARRERRASPTPRPSSA